PHAGLARNRHRLYDGYVREGRLHDGDAPDVARAMGFSNRMTARRGDARQGQEECDEEQKASGTACSTLHGDLRGKRDSTRSAGCSHPIRRVRRPREASSEGTSIPAGAAGAKHLGWKHGASACCAKESAKKNNGRTAAGQTVLCRG